MANNFAMQRALCQRYNSDREYPHGVQTFTGRHRHGRIIGTGANPGIKELTNLTQLKLFTVFVDMWEKLFDKPAAAWEGESLHIY
jgi:hypothetical protein